MKTQRRGKSPGRRVLAYYSHNGGLLPKLPRPPDGGIPAATRQKMAEELRNQAAFINHIAGRATEMPPDYLFWMLEALAEGLRYIRSRALM